MIFSLFTRPKVIDIRLNNMDRELAQSNAALTERLTGILILGAAVLCYEWQNEFRMLNLLYQYEQPLKLASIIFTISIAVITANVLNSNASMFELYPKVTLAAFRKSYFLLNTISWIVYLFVYEMYLRGVLLIAIAEATNIYFSVVLNILFYAWLHIFKGKFEFYGSIVAGLVFCILTLVLNSVIPAIVIHIVMALSTDYIAISKKLKVKVNQ